MVSALPAGRARRLADGRFSLGAVVDAAGELARGNQNLIWGWKRDVGSAFRAVYFGGELGHRGDEVLLARWYLFYRHRADARAIRCIADRLAQASELTAYVTCLKVTALPDGRADLRLELGAPTTADRDRVRRLQLRRPRRRLPDIVLPQPLPLALASTTLPADIYVGSGLSYEAGLPTLCDMHLAFGVDNSTCTQFAVGEEDDLPARLADDLEGCVGAFCSVHFGALRAAPSVAMRHIADLHASGAIRKVFTDNVDNLLSKVNVPFERTRGSGVFNEVYPAVFESPRLLVVGVAADRRSVVKQARAAGLKVITVNPCEKVAPMVRHLDYVRPDDPFFQTTAEIFFDSLVETSAAQLRSRAELVQA
ncbi:MAG: hypothetical protein JF588_01745 [Caulobacterales bacterium]|nr:hypothetical protein [Caulobacterales bacterium]